MGLAVERVRKMGRKLAALYRFLFGDSVRAFGSLSLILLVCLAVVPAKDHFREWIRIQSQYLKLIRNRGDAATLQRRFQGGLQQIWLPRLGVVDRCTTCHVALKEASMADVSLQPFRPHPVIPHSLDQFGCVFCHRGQGAATTVEEAHAAPRRGSSRFCPRATWSPPAANATRMPQRARRNSIGAGTCWHATAA